MANKVKLSDYLSKEELTHFSTANDVRAWGMFFITWGMIAGAFAMAIVWPNPLTFLAAILILGGRQLGLGVINHDCAHHAFFSNNDVLVISGASTVETVPPRDAQRDGFPAFPPETFPTKLGKEGRALQSKMSRSSGDEAGTLKGMISSKNMDTAKPKSHASKVKAQGTKAMRHLSLFRAESSKQIKKIEKEQKKK